MNPLALFAIAAVGGGIYWATRKSATADNLKVTVEGVAFNPLRNIRGGQAEIPITLGLGNARSGTLKIDIVDLAFSVDGKALGSVRDYNLRLQIKSTSYQTQKFTLKVPILRLAMVMGSKLVQAIADYKADPTSDKKAALRSAAPKNILCKGVIRAEGFAIDVDESIALNIDL